jgi:RHS repeat-associated protein
MRGDSLNLVNYFSAEVESVRKRDGIILYGRGGDSWDAQKKSPSSGCPLASTNLTGRMVTASNNGYTWHYSYDITGHVNLQTLEIGTQGAGGNLMAQAQYTYTIDQYEEVYTINYPGALNPVSSLSTGQQYANGYDLMGRHNLLYTPSPFAILAATPYNTTAYSAAGQLQSWTEGTTTLNRTYDANRGWMTGLFVSNSSGSILSQSYSTYYANGQLETMTDQVGNGAATTTNYSYDYLSRLTSAANTNGATQMWGFNWTYDDFGNRTAQTSTGGTQPGPSSSLAYDNTNYTNRITTSGYTYDANGNLTAFPGPQGATSVTYDAFDRAVSFTVGSSTSTVNYDAFGRRIAKTFSGGMQRLYFYSPQGQLLAEYDNPASGVSPSRTTQYFAGQRLGQWTDRVGSKRADSGSSSQYYPYGEEITNGTAKDTFKFAQTYRDSDSGLDYASQRFYASGIGRFLTGDSFDASASTSSPQSWNRYAYVQGDPVNSYDPSGLLLADVGTCETWNDYIRGACDLTNWGYWGTVIGLGDGGGYANFRNPPAASPPVVPVQLRITDDCYTTNSLTGLIERDISYQLYGSDGNQYTTATVTENIVTNYTTPYTSSGQANTGVFKDSQSLGTNPNPTVVTQQFVVTTSNGLFTNSPVTVNGFGGTSSTLYITQYSNVVYVSGVSGLLGNSGGTFKNGVFVPNKLCGNTL